MYNFVFLHSHQTSLKSLGKIIGVISQISHNTLNATNLKIVNPSTYKCNKMTKKMFQYLYYTLYYMIRFMHVIVNLMIYDFAFLHSHRSFLLFLRKIRGVIWLILKNTITLSHFFVSRLFCNEEFTHAFQLVGSLHKIDINARLWLGKNLNTIQPDKLVEWEIYSQSRLFQMRILHTHSS